MSSAPSEVRADREDFAVEISWESNADDRQVRSIGWFLLAGGVVACVAGFCLPVQLFFLGLGLWLLHVFSEPYGVLTLQSWHILGGQPRAFSLILASPRKRLDSPGRPRRR